MRKCPATSAAHPSMRTDVLRGVTLPSGHLLVGLSGGADSVALLVLLQESGARLSAVHVNHGLRGGASDGDEAFVRQLCRERGVPLWVFRADPGDRSDENWARDARYGFFREAMALSGADALVLAHHREDQAETMLLHLLRGTGLQGLGAMAADTQRDGMRILRPLLGVSRAALREALTARGLAWREDATNADPRYLRNALRRDVMPLLEQLSLERILEADPDCIFIAQRGDDTEGTRENLRQLFEGDTLWSKLTAVQTGKVWLMDKALYSLKPNHRWGEAYEKLEAILEDEA